MLSILQRSVAGMNLGSDTSSSGPQEWSDEILQPWDSISERVTGSSQVPSTTGMDDGSGHNIKTAVKPLGSRGCEESPATCKPRTEP